MSFISDLLINVSAFRITIGNKINALKNLIDGKQNTLTNGLHTKINSNKIDVAFDDNTYIKDKSNNDRLLFGNTQSTDVIIKGAVANGDFKVKDSTDTDLFRINGSNKVAYFPQLPAPQTGASNNLAIFDSGNGLWKSNVTIGDLALASQIPINYITTNTTQTGLSGNKTTSGVWTFESSLRVNAKTFMKQPLVAEGVYFNPKNENGNLGIEGHSNYNYTKLFGVIQYVSGELDWKYTMKSTGFRIDQRTNNDIVLAGGGHRPVSDFAQSDSLPKSIYNYPNGILVKTDIPDGSNTMFTMEIEGNSYNSHPPIIMRVQGYLYNTNSNIVNTTAISTLSTQGNVEVFIYDGFLHFWFSQSSSFQTHHIKVLSTTPVNRVVSITNAPKPATGTTKDVSIVVNKIWNSFNDGAGSGLDADLLDGKHASDFALASSIPTVNNGQLTLSTGTGLSGSGTFTANQAGGSTFSVAVASTHKLPTTAEWNALPTTNTTYTSSNGILLTGTNFTPVYGTTANTIAQGDDVRINNGQTAFDWGNHASAGYALASQLSGYVPTSRTLTINGTTFDLSADRTWTIPIPTQVNISQGAGITVSGTYPNLTITNTAPNATHTGDVTGATALTIANNAVTFPKMQNIATATFLGRLTAGTGNVEALTVAQMQTALGFSTQTLANSTSNLIVSNTVQRAALTGDVTASQNSNATTIANGVVTNAKMANMGVGIKGRNTGTGAPLDLTVAEVQTMLGVVTPNNGTFTVQGTGALTGTGSTSANASANTSATLDLTTATKDDITAGKNASTQVTSLFADAVEYFKYNDATVNNSIDTNEAFFNLVNPKTTSGLTIAINEHHINGARLVLQGVTGMGGIVTYTGKFIMRNHTLLGTLTIEGEIDQEFVWDANENRWREVF